MILIEWLQSFAFPGLTFFFKSITFLGNEAFYILILPFTFWLWDREKSISLIYILLPSLLINFWLKELLQMPRPEGLEMIVQTGYGFPSGHAQGSMTLWLSIAILAKKRWMNCLAGMLIVLIGISRLYLGVHYPTDILGGWIIGFLLVWLYFSYVHAFVTSRVSGFSKFNRFILSTLLIFLCMIIYPYHEGISIPAVLWGISIGIIFYPQSQAPKITLINLLIVLVGIIGLILIWAGLKAAFPPQEIFRFIRYALIGIWIVVCIPKIQSLIIVKNYE